MFVPSFTFRPWYIMIFYHLYANLVLCFFIHANKKRDCNLAVPHSEALVLPSIPNKQHRDPLRMYSRTHYTRVPYLIHTYEHLYAAMFWNV